MNAVDILAPIDPVQIRTAIRVPSVLIDRIDAVERFNRPRFDAFLRERQSPHFDPPATSPFGGCYVPLAIAGGTAAPVKLAEQTDIPRASDWFIVDGVHSNALRIIAAVVAQDTRNAAYRYAQLTARTLRFQSDGTVKDCDRIVPIDWRSIVPASVGITVDDRAKRVTIRRIASDSNKTIAAAYGAAVGRLGLELERGARASVQSFHAFDVAGSLAELYAKQKEERTGTV